jgi:hypothetical protein
MPYSYIRLPLPTNISTWTVMWSTPLPGDIDAWEQIECGQSVHVLYLHMYISPCFILSCYLNLKSSIAIFNRPVAKCLIEIYEIRRSMEILRPRVARWYIFKPKVQIWVNFGGPWNGKGWYILWSIVVYYSHLCSTFYGHLTIKWQFGSW